MLTVALRAVTIWEMPFSHGNQLQLRSDVELLWSIAPWNTRGTLPLPRSSGRRASLGFDRYSLEPLGVGIDVTVFDIVYLFDMTMIDHDVCFFLERSSNSFKCISYAS